MKWYYLFKCYLIGNSNTKIPRKFNLQISSSNNLLFNFTKLEYITSKRAFFVLFCTASLRKWPYDLRNAAKWLYFNFKCFKTFSFFTFSVLDFCLRELWLKHWSTLLLYHIIRSQNCRLCTVTESQIESLLRHNFLPWNPLKMVLTLFQPLLTSLPLSVTHCKLCLVMTCRQLSRRWLLKVMPPLNFIVKFLTFLKFQTIAVMNWTFAMIY